MDPRNTILVPSAPVEVVVDSSLLQARMIGKTTRREGKAVLVEVIFPDGRHTLVPWRDVSTSDSIGLHLLGAEKSLKDEKVKKK